MLQYSVVCYIEWYAWYDKAWYIKSYSMHIWYDIVWCDGTAAQMFSPQPMESSSRRPSQFTVHSVYNTFAVNVTLTTVNPLRAFHNAQ